MKCVKATKSKLINDEFKQEIVRASDKEAKDCVNSGRWIYTAKHVWKRSGRKYMKGGRI